MLRVATTVLFGYSGTLDTFIVPTTGNYTVTSIGASGGADDNSAVGGLGYAGGLGAKVSGVVALTAGEVLQIAVGGVGASVLAQLPAGGGGGSFVVGPENTPLEVAGGGGGAAYTGAGGDATGSGTGDGLGGSAGFGFAAGGGGGGLLGDGATDASQQDGEGGRAFIDGAAGGTGAYSYGNGGFGGGGGGGADGVFAGAGGGGGYTGGAGGDDAGSSFGSNGVGDPGDGGSSFVSGADQLVTLDASAGDGLVTIGLDIAGAPVIGGTTRQATTDEATVTPFSGVTISDPGNSPAETVSVSYDASNGKLTDPNSDTDGSSVSTGSYAVTGSATQVQADLRGLTFAPTIHQVAPGDSVTTDFALSVSNETATVQDLTTQVTATAVDDPPIITGTQAKQLDVPGATFEPFGGVAITDPDVGVTDTLGITLEDAQGSSTETNGTLTAPNPNAGLAHTGSGYYTLTGTPAQLTTELDSLGFVPSSSASVTQFSLYLIQQLGNDYAYATDDKTSVVVPDFIDGPTDGNGQIAGMSGTDVITAYQQSNTITGDGGDDTIFAGSGSATVYLPTDNASVSLGGSGNTVLGGDGAITVTGASGGSSVVNLGNGNDTVMVGGANDTITLGNGNDGVSGTQGMAFIVTGNGNDTITLAGSDNNIYAGGGNNEIQGGAGNDTFVLSPAGIGFDSIAGFTEINGDVLDLRTALSATTWNGDSGTLGSYLQVTGSHGNTDLSIAPSGNGTSAPIARLIGAGDLGLADLLSHHSLVTS